MTDPQSLRTGAARGQTLPDFAVGIAIFLLTVTFVFLFVPQMFLPYEDQEQPVVAERAASDLGTSMLADETTPSKLNETCTLAFFDAGAGDGCRFDTDESVTDQLGVAPTYSVNVTLRDAPSDDPGSRVLCEVDGAVDDCESGGEQLAIGPPVPAADRSVATARRGIFVGETGAVIEVGVW